MLKTESCTPYIETANTYMHSSKNHFRYLRNGIKYHRCSNRMFITIHEMLNLSSNFIVMLNCVDDYNKQMHTEIDEISHPDETKVVVLATTKTTPNILADPTPKIVQCDVDLKQVEQTERKKEQIEKNQQIPSQVEIFLNSNEGECDLLFFDKQQIRIQDMSDDTSCSQRTNQKENRYREDCSMKRKSKRKASRRRQKKPTDDSNTSKSISATVLQMKTSYVKNDGKDLNWNDRLYQHGKRVVSVRKRLEEAQHKEMNRGAEFERRFQEKRLQSMRSLSRSSSRSVKERAISLYELSKPKQLEGRRRRHKITDMARRRAESISSQRFGGSSILSSGSHYSISANSTDTTSRTTKTSSSDES
jgi:hypothetical protein